MLNFRTVTIFFSVVFILLAGLYFIYPFSLLYFALVITIYISLTFYGSFFVGSNFYMKMICNVETDEKIIAITFDDGPDSKITPEILTLLQEFDIKATFFCIGNKLEGNEDLIKRISNEGHIVANHTWSHSKWIDFYTSAKMTNELYDNQNYIENITGDRPRFFRPPYGVTNPAIKKATNKSESIAIGWNIRSLDTQLKRDADNILIRVTSRLKPGSIVLFHDTNPEIVTILRRFFEYTEQNNFKIVRLDELVNEKAYV